jgi:tetratricopeptide (TPR) repeat protein
MERLAALAGSMADLWVLEGRHHQLKRWVTAVLGAKVSARHEAYLHRAAAAVALYTDGDPGAAAQSALIAASAFDSLGLPARAAGMRLTAGNALRYVGQHDRAVGLIQLSITELEERNELSRFAILARYHQLALVYDDVGDARAAPLIQQYLREAEAEQSVLSQADALSALALMSAFEGKIQEADRLVARSLELADSSDLTYEEIRADILAAAGWCALAQQRPDEAKELFQKAVSLTASMGYRLILPDLVSGLGVTAAALGEYARAAQLLAAGAAQRAAKSMVIVGRLPVALHAAAMDQIQGNLTPDALRQAQEAGSTCRDIVREGTSW